MTNTQYNRLAAIITEGTTLAQLEEITTRNHFDVANPESKESYVDAAMYLLTGWNPFARSFVWHADYLFNLRAFPEAIQEALIKEVV